MAQSQEQAFALLSDYSRRIFLFNGKTKDYFLMPDGRYMRFELVLHEYLKKELNYDIVAFVDHNGLFFWDEESAREAMQAKSRREKPRPASIRGLMKRPKGITTRPPAEAEAPAPVQWRYDFAGDARMLLPQVMGILQRDISAAVVVLERSLLFNIHPQDPVFFNFRGFLCDTMTFFPHDNRNLMIFAENTENIQDLARQFGEMGLGDLFFTRENSQSDGKAGFAYIGPPGREECRRLFSWFRVVKQRPVHLPDADAMGVLAASWSKEKNQGLHVLAARLEKVREFRLDSVEEKLEMKAEKSAQELLDDLVGMEEVKKQVLLQLATLNREEAKKEDAKKEEMFWPKRLGAQKTTGTHPYLDHFALLGNPGTGKTTVARIIGKLLQERGLLETGHFIGVTRGDLVGEYVGSTAVKTRQVLERAMGGVLFIDEAYSLYKGESDTFGQECIDTLIEAMETQRGRFVMILAGYPNEMRRLIASNPGFRRRVKEIVIPDYTDAQLAEIMRRMLAKDACESDVRENLDFYVKNLLANRTVRNDWGNAGEIRRICEDARKRCDARRGKELCAQDFEHPEYFQPTSVRTETTLDDLIGMASLKQHLKKLFVSFKSKQNRGQKVDVGHYFFIGNPGTGKTTVAQILARELYARGLLRTPRCLEHTAMDFIGRYVGETENRTREIFEKALGGVLFIDEAHQLVDATPRGETYSYGQAVLKTLVPLMENHRHEISVVFAGYPQQMKRLLEYDPGMKSRIKSTIRFEDYSNEELLQIFLIQFKKEYPDMSFPLEMQAPLADFFGKVRALEREKFGNARMVRNFVGKLVDTLESRWSEEPESGKNISMADLENAMQEYMHQNM